MKEYHSKKLLLQKGLKERREQKQVANKNEKELRKNRGRKEKILRVSILEDVFKTFNVIPSSYHGGDMEGPSIRRAMENGIDMFEAVAKHIRERVVRVDDLNTAPDSEIEQVCKDYGELLILMDGIFSDYNTPRGSVNEEVIQRLSKRLKTAMLEMNRMQMSVTPKCHVALEHGVEQLWETKGFADMKEDRLERGHQDRASHEPRLVRLQNKSHKMESQAKMQDIQLIKEVRDIQQHVTQNSKRRLKRKVSLNQEHNAFKKQIKTEK